MPSHPTPDPIPTPTPISTPIPDPTSLASTPKHTSSPKITPEHIKTLARLSRIHCTPEQESALYVDLEKMLSYVAQLNAIDTTGVPPCLQVIERLPHEEWINVWVDDLPSDPLARDIFLRNAPDSIAGMVRTPPVLNQE